MSKLGPGILFAGAAIGTSHLVQSTRAGAVYGLALLGIIVFANIIKYPAFLFGPRYAAATGTSLIEGYRRIGKWAVVVISLGLILVHAIIIAATAITTAGIGLASLDLGFDARVFAAGFTILGMLILFFGGYHILDRLTKVFVIILTVTTIVATVLAIPKIDWAVAQFALPHMDVATFAFIVALMGFMPSAMDLSILHSLWSVEKARDDGQPINTKDAELDFNIGYIISAGLAICFLLMGAGVMHSAQIEPANSAVEFASQVIGLYTASLGSWAGTIVGISAFGVMFTTLITILDGFPRVHARSFQTLMRKDDEVEAQVGNKNLLNGVTVLLAVAAIAILFAFMQNFTTFIDFVTITAFVVGPVIAIFNHIAMTSDNIPAEHLPSTAMRIWSWVGIIALSGIALAYLYTLIGY